MTGETTRTEPKVDRFLSEYLGVWPPRDAITVVGSDVRTRPGWDGSIRDVVGVLTPDAGVISVRPDLVETVRSGVRARATLTTDLPPALGRPEARAFLGKFRWSTSPADAPDAGEWLDVSDPRVPPWLHPFGGQVLVTLIDGRYAAGVGIKKHNEAGLELSVGTENEHRGKGLATRLVAQAARWVLARGAVPIYLHDPANVASDRTATAAGFRDLGWQILGVWSPGTLPG
jgi:GNAT superfamily N-acetyltransferase